MRDGNKLNVIKWCSKNDRYLIQNNQKKIRCIKVPSMDFMAPRLRDRVQLRPKPIIFTKLSVWWPI